MYLGALLPTIHSKMGWFVTFIFMNWEEVCPFMCFHTKCPDFLLKMSRILDPRIPPFRRSDVKLLAIFSIIKLPCTTGDTIHANKDAGIAASKNHLWDIWHFECLLKNICLLSTIETYNTIFKIKTYLIIKLSGGGCFRMCLI